MYALRPAISAEKSRSVWLCPSLSSTKLPGQRVSVLQLIRATSAGGKSLRSAPAACSTSEKVALKSASWTVLGIGDEPHHAREQERSPLFLTPPSRCARMN